MLGSNALLERQLARQLDLRHCIVKMDHVRDVHLLRSSSGRYGQNNASWKNLRCSISLTWKLNAEGYIFIGHSGQNRENGIL